MHNPIRSTTSEVRNRFGPCLVLSRLLVIGLAGGCGLLSAVAEANVQEPADAERPPAEARLFYETRVQPLLEKHCYQCHRDDPEELGGNFSMGSRTTWLQGGDTGPAIDLENPLDSLVVKCINYDVYEMPPDGKLSATEIADLVQWIRLGLPGLSDSPVEEAPQAGSKPPEVDDQARRWWAFQSVRPVELPAVQDPAWIRNEIDRFVLARLEAAGIRPALPASRATLIRRAYYDLLGLPPTLDQVNRFVDDPDPQAYEKLIDQLLESPHYGEKWARHWLDLVRYAESNSFERDGTKPFAWRYRDYVIRALNSDKPYDLFLREQLAGDEFPEVTADSLTATGYYRLGQWDDEPADPLQAKYDELDDILATTGQTMLGLTINCARCHDHKIDPVPQTDYYRLLAFFQNIRRYGIRAEETVRDASLVTFGTAASRSEAEQHAAQIRELDEQIARLEALVKPDFQPVEHEEFQYSFQRLPLMKKRVGSRLTAEQFQSYCQLVRTRQRLIENPVAGEVEILCVKEAGREVPPAHVLVRGNPHVRGPQVSPGFLSVLSMPAPESLPDGASPGNASSCGLRTQLAQWITDPTHPLTARVWVNRVWQYHFGRGIVRSSSDFGYQGTPPTHPELLDWLAAELISNGWKLKPLHRLMMLSNTYQMASTGSPELEQRDPENDLFWRFNLRRLSAEEIRDSVLRVSGQLRLEPLYGPSIYPLMPPEVLAGQSMPGNGWEPSPPEAQNRRSIYVHVKRSLQLPILSSFDSADSDSPCPVRFVTTQPTQALGLLNSQFSLDQATHLAQLALRLAGEDRTDQVRWVLGRVLQREPTAEEITRGSDLVFRLTQEERLDPQLALRNFCLLTLNLNEFMYLD